MQRGFSLVELSIVLVILGLLVGGVLSGQALIEGAAIKAQISQIDSYRAAAMSFKDKYFYYPGDLPNAGAFGLHPRNNACGGLGDGNGLIEGTNNVNLCGPAFSSEAQAGETLLFWQDLGRMGFIPGPRTIEPDANMNNNGYTLDDFYPQAKLGRNYVFVWSGGPGVYNQYYNDGYRYFSVAAPSGAQEANASYDLTAGMTVLEAYNIDTKVDDGLPQSGIVMALYTNGPHPYYDASPSWAAGGGLLGASDETCCTNPTTYNRPITTATAYATTNCYDNGGVAGPQTYSFRNADSKNCAISFQW